MDPAQHNKIPQYIGNYPPKIWKGFTFEQVSHLQQAIYMYDARGASVATRRRQTFTWSGALGQLAATAQAGGHRFHAAAHQDGLGFSFAGSIR
jgi:hypothetical protein